MKPPKGFQPPDKRVRFVALPSRRLHVLASSSVVPGKTPDDLRGSITWVLPEAGTSPEELAGAVKLVRKAGAVRAVALPVEAEAAAVPQSVVALPVGAGVGVRAIVEGMLAEVKEQPTEVREIVETVMAEAGL